MKAITREEKIISGENLTPITRKEMFLAKASGQNIETPTPITREEIFLSKIKGGGGSVEGTAIPVGVPVEKIYFNTSLSVDETVAYLSQLTYFDVGFEALINVIFGGHDNFLIAMKSGERTYTLIHTTQPNLEGDVLICFTNKGLNTGFLGWYQIPRTVEIEGDNNESENVPVSYCCVGGIALGLPSLTDLDGLPVGVENEKIKNVLSITPFGVSGGSSSNKPNAYTVSSVDELPSDAVDGSMAIVSNNDIKGNWLLNEQVAIEEGMDLYPTFTMHNNQDNSVIKVTNIYVIDEGGYLQLYYMDEHENEYGLYNTELEFFVAFTFRNIRVIEADAESEAWIRANGRKLPSLYIRENGEWVYKCEVA